MSTEITLPALGESDKEGTISRWLKQVGDQVEVDEPLLEVSTDKVDTEVPSPVSGTLLEIKIPEDEVAAVGAVIAIVGDPSEAGSAPAPESPAPAKDDPAPTPPASNTPDSGSGQVHEVALPALGESDHQGTISRWLKAVGDKVEADEPLLEVSTDKVDTEVPSPVSGTLLEIKVAEDEVAAVGSIIAIIGDESAASAPAKPEAPEPPEIKADGPSGKIQPEMIPAHKTEAPPAPKPATDEGLPTPPVKESTPYVTPLVRKLAKELGVDLNEVKGTGVGDRIRKEDVVAAAEAKKAAASAPAPAPTPEKPAAPKPSAPSPKAGTTEKMSKIRQVVAQRMRESLDISAQLTAAVEVDFTGISKLRNKVKNDFRAREGVGLTYLAFIAKAVAEALREFPMLNCTGNFEEKTITFGKAENVGIAVDTPKGLFVPVIHDAGDLTVGGLAKKIGELAKKARDGKLSGGDMSGGTFTITNYGSAGTLFDTPIINQPEVGILGTGALVKRPVVITDEFGNDVIAIRDMMYLSLTYDHRLVDGADAGRFLSFLKSRLEAADFGAEFGI